jgi:hypothetical protein
MLHLAQVKKKDPEGKVNLRLLAQQKSEYAWSLLPEEDIDFWVDTLEFEPGMLVLLELSPLRQVQQIQDATPWLLDVIQKFLTFGITPENLQEEVQRAEQWRQSLTLQSQELGRRALEMEARRDQIQELEENLKTEKEKLEKLAAESKINVNNPAN